MRLNTYLMPGAYLRKYPNQSLLAVITCDLQLFKKLKNFFPFSIITVTALLPDRHEIHVNYIKTKNFRTIKTSNTELV